MRWASVVMVWCGLAVVAMSADYDPLAVSKATIEKVDGHVSDVKRSRAIPLRVYLPKETTPTAVVLFSHGLGGAKTNNEYLGNHWAARGYVVVFLQHAGSDEFVWKDKAPAERMNALRQAAGVENFQLRVQDVPVVIDELEVWNKKDGHALKGRMDLKRIGMSGHSFGAVTTQAVSGQTYAIGKGFTDSRIKAAIMMSPSSPRLGDPKRAFGSVKIPWLLLTGTKDNSPIGDIDVKARMNVFPALPPGDKYELVLEKAEHSAFGDRPLPGETEKRNPNHHRVIRALSTAFWDAYLGDHADAKKWLASDAVRRLLEKGDTWQMK